MANDVDKKTEDVPVETGDIKRETPNWVQERLNPILEDEEEILFEAKGRVEFKSASGLSALIFWLKYIIVNIFGFLVTLKVKRTAWLAVTNKRCIIVTNDGFNWPLWVIPFSRKNVDYSILKENIASVNCSDGFAFWFIRSRGINLESTGGFSIIFNGMSKKDIDKAKSFLTSY
jgi:hypothetical protein